jgi:hypothetical protein
LTIATSRRSHEAKTAFLDKLFIQVYLKPVYSGLRELTIPYPQPDWDDLQRTGELKVLYGHMEDVLIGSLVHDQEVPGGRPLVAGNLEVDAEQGMYIGERRSLDLRANAAQGNEIFCVRQLLDLIADDQNMDARENRTIRHGRAPPATGRTWSKRSIPHAGPERERRLARGNPALRRWQLGLPML